MSEPKGFFSMDIHRLFRTFIPGLISLLALLPFYWVSKGKFTIDFVNSTEIFIFLIIAYIWGVLIEWITDSIFHWLNIPWNYTYGKEVTERVRELCRIFDENMDKLDVTSRLEYATLFDYILHDDVEKNLQRGRIYFMFSRIHSIEATISGIITSTVFGFLFWILKTTCFNLWGWIIFTLVIYAIIILMLFLYRNYCQDDLIAYEKVFIRNNKEKFKEMIRK